MDEPVEGVLIVQSDNYTGPSLNLIKRNFPQSNATRLNKNNLEIVTVFGSLYEEKKIPQLHMEKRPSSCLSSLPSSEGVRQV